MLMEQSHLGDKQNPAALVREEEARELQDVITRYLPSFYRRAYRYVSDPHDAEDAVQDALLSAYKHLHQFKGTAKMATWLTSIVTNSALTQLRKRPRHPHVSLDEGPGGEQDYSVADKLTDARPSPERECIRSEMHGNLMQSVMELSPSLRDAIQLCDLDGLTTKEVAHMLGVPHGTVKTRVSRGRMKLRQLMGGV